MQELTLLRRHYSSEQPINFSIPMKIQIAFCSFGNGEADPKIHRKLQRIQKSQNSNLTVTSGRRGWVEGGGGGSDNLGDWD